MKLKLVLFITFILGLVELNAQFDSLKSKTKLVYNFSRQQVLTNHSGSTSDFNKILYTKKIDISVDTIFYLTGKSRKLIVLSRCLNDIVLNENNFIFNKIIKRPQDFIRMDSIIGIPIIDEKDVKYSSRQITAIYQFDHAVYFITLPDNFFKEVKQNLKLISEMDKSLLDARSDIAYYGNFVTDIFIYWNKQTIPMKSIILLNKFNNTTNNAIDDDDDTEFTYQYEKKSSGFKLGEDTKKIILNNIYINNSDKYIHKSSKNELLKTIYISKSFGIIHAYSYSFDSEKRIRYVNVLDFEEIKR